MFAPPATAVLPFRRSSIALTVALLLAMVPCARAQGNANAPAPASEPALKLLASTSVPASGDQPAASPLKLNAAPRLTERLARNPAPPAFIAGDKMSGRPDLEITLEGDATLRRPGLSARADHLIYDQTTDVITVRGNVRANEMGNLYRAPQGQVQADAFEGVFQHPAYSLLINGGHGQAQELDLLDPNRQVIINGDYTTCWPADPVTPDQGDIRSASNPNWQPDWTLRAKRVTIDQETKMGEAEGGVLRFKGVPILAAPSMTFPIDNSRLSGWLPPTIGLDTQSGLTLAVPYYWNIAPNRDATFTPTIMTRRGLEMEGQFRYLENNYHGSIDAMYMPDDQLRNRDRWSLFIKHSGSLDTGLPLFGQLGLNVDYNRVSDNNFWQDFSLDQIFNYSRTFPADGSLSWSHPGTYGDWSATLQAQTWQVLQQPASIIVPPYSRMPDLTVRWGRNAATNGTGDWNYNIEGDYTRFQAPSALTNQPNANRAYLDAWLSHPWLSSWGFLTPKVEFNAVNYQFSSPLTGNGAQSANIVVPTASLDGGLIFERPAHYLGRDFTQTLEPRLMYVYTPYRDQSAIPLYDTGPYDFNFATIWANNAFVGHDRFSDNNTLTGGVTSRLIDPATGSEMLRLAIAQRYRFSPERVTLPDQISTNRGWSDLILGAGVNWNPRWGVDALQQYNMTTHQSTRTTLNLRYAPGPMRLLNFAYSREAYGNGNVDNNKYFDIGFQWPLSERARQQIATGNPSARQGGACAGGSWFGVGRLNYSMTDSQIVDGIFGVEYDAGCWVGRIVLEKLETTSATSTKRILFQLELSGLARLGTNPISALRQNIPGYQPTGEPGMPPSRFSNYE
ncbi:MAG: LPS-assembly protein LptD [Burkholderiaceae bacterium]|nr:LPS-assembly protein LptD [Burkholderiaceae bacterium]